MARPREVARPSEDTPARARREEGGREGEREEGGGREGGREEGVVKIWLPKWVNCGNKGGRREGGREGGGWEGVNEGSDR